jgi:hypothetical protein
MPADERAVCVTICGIGTALLAVGWITGLYWLGNVIDHLH